MISATVEPYSWPRRRWWGGVTLVFLLHLGLIFWFAERKSAGPAPLADGPKIYLASGQMAELSGLSDPTLLVLPNRHGFSGQAWLQAPVLEYHPVEWTEPPRLLQLPVQQLGWTLGDYVRNSLSGPVEVAAKPEPLLNTAEFVTIPDLMPTQSTVSVEGELASRPLISVFALNSCQAPDILTNSIVQIAVDQEGRVASLPVLLSRSGSRDADNSALSLAKTARFQPIRRHSLEKPGALTPKLNNGNHTTATNAAPKLNWGRLVFNWHTIPMPSTNAAPAPP